MSTTSLERGKQCSFRVADIICPDPRRALMQITADLEVTGEIAFRSYPGRGPDRFVIVEVEGILSPLVVSAERLQPVAGLDAEPNLPPVVIGHLGADEIGSMDGEK